MPLPPKKGGGRVNKRNRRGRGMKIGAVGEGGEGNKCHRRRRGMKIGVTGEGVE
jgi:hypothetical protein